MNIDTLAKMLIFATVRIENWGPSGRSTGTGFIMNLDLPEGSQATVLVTNKHVIRGAQRLTAHFIPKKAGLDEPDLGNGVAVDLQLSGFGHPDSEVDVVVLPLFPALDQLRDKLYVCPLSMSILLTETPDVYLDAVEELTFVGYPNGYHDPII
ncbi:hypothetical protein [Streptomyces sp. NPDC056661]|uniref:hypothetical protein n=1 Tax=Streptomyces sp. NPDC056661 TaxID=3345898 RepID=UPI00367443D1